MEPQRFLNVNVPVGPVVATGKLTIFVVITDLFKMRVVGAIRFQQKIFCATVDLNRRTVSQAYRFRQRKQIVVTSRGICTDHARKLNREAIPGIRAEGRMREIERSGMAVR